MKRATLVSRSSGAASQKSGHTVGGLVAVLSLALGVGLAADGARAQDGGEHPDFSGIYFPAGFARRAQRELPFNETAAALAEEYKSEFRTEDDPGRFCIWPGMPRAPWGAPFPLEVFHRDKDLTIYWEGYGMFRKIYMADHNPPDPILHTAMGHSIAHWEGDTLVIETSYLKVYPYLDDLPNTSDALVTERLRQERRTVNGQEKVFLIDDITLTDPKLYTQPIELHAEAELRPDLYLLEYTCTNTIWEEYLEGRGLTLPDIDALPAE
jgi:hypothetical protein